MKISLYYVLYATYMKLIQLAYALCDMIYKYRKEIMKKLGFTLAETLITLGIIGVVSALTIPSLIAKHQEKTRIIKLKKYTHSCKMHSILQYMKMDRLKPGE